MTRSELLDEAKSIVCGDREQDYGSPENSFHRIAEFWGTYLNQQITPVDVAAMMALLKLARVADGHGKTDNWVDLAGYAACGAEIESGGAHEEKRAESNHADDCAQDNPHCKCLTCKKDRDNSIECCYRHSNYDGMVGFEDCPGIRECPDYEKEDDHAKVELRF